LNQAKNQRGTLRAMRQHGGKGKDFSFINSCSTSGYAGFLSKVITSGICLCGENKAFLKKRFAACISRFSDNMKSMVFPSVDLIFLYVITVAFFAPTSANLPLRPHILPRG
jgi:hypothetical protein